MKNENKNAMPGVYNSFNNEFKLDGLTKLEYAAIHIAQGLCAADAVQPNWVAKNAIAVAKQIFKQLEDDSTATVSDTEL